GEPLLDHRICRFAVDDQERYAGGLGNLPGSLALLLLEIGGVDHHRKACIQGCFGQCVQALIGSFTSFRAVDAGAQAGRLLLLFTMQTLALHIRAQPEHAQRLDQSQGNMAFAGCRNTMSDGQETRGYGAVAFSPVGIAAVLADDHLALDGILLLIKPEQADLGPDQRAVSLVQVDQLQRGVVAGALQPAIEETARLAFQAAVFKVHGQKGCVGCDVDKAEGVVEFDTVEQNHLVVDDGGVTQVQITVTLADVALLAALLQQGVQALDTGFGPVDQCV